MQNPNGHFAGHFAGHGPPVVGHFPTFAGVFPSATLAPTVAASSQQATDTKSAASASPWIEYKTPEGKPYYFNPITNQTVWEKPQDMGSQTRGSTPAASTETSNSNSAGSWVEYKTDDGKAYYYNTVTKVTTWTMPEEMMAKQQIKDSPASNSSSADHISAPLPSSTPPSNSGDSKFNKGNFFFGSSNSSHRQSPARQGGPGAANTDDESSNSNLPSSTPFSDPSTTPPQSPAKGGGGSNNNRSSKTDFEEFKEILLEKKIASNASWENCLKYVAHDARFTRFRSHPERKTFFNQYKTMRIREEKEEQRQRLKAARDSLEHFLQTSERVNSSLRYRQACELFRDVQCWNAVPDGQRREIFEDALTEITRLEREKAKELRKRNMSVLSDVLDSMNLITYRTTWEEAQLLLFDNPIFAQDAQLLSMDKEDALIVFQDHIRQLEAEEETEKANERKMKAREQRRNREAFLTLLDELHASGKLNSLSKWSSLYHDISADARFEAMLSQPLNGSTPLDLFKFYLEELKARYEDEKALIRDIMKSAKFQVGPNTEFSEFVELLSQDPRSGKLDSGNVKLMHEKLVEREREQEKERLREEARSKKKLEQVFIGLLEQMNPPLREDSTWTEVRPVICKEEAFGAIQSEEERVAIFEDVVRSLVENCTHRHNYKSSHKHKSSSAEGAQAGPIELDIKDLEMQRKKLLRELALN